MTDPVTRSTARAAEKAIGLRYQLWFWGEAIAFDAVVQAADVTGQEALRAFPERVLVDWSRQTLARGVQRSDVYAPLRAMLRMYEITGRSELVEAAVQVADYIASAPADGGAHLHHLQGYPPMVFVDFLYYVGPYLGQLATATGERRYTEVAIAQTLGHLKRLQDTTSGLTRHVYDPTRAETNGVAWGRGNGWALLGLVDTLAILPAEEPGRDAIEAGFRQMLSTCLALQDGSGMWHTILDDPHSPLENSIAAFFYAAMAKATRIGLVHMDVAGPTARAWSAVASRIQEDGMFPISMTEWPAWNPEAYYTRPIGVNPWGQGCFIRAACEHVMAGEG